MCVVANAFLSSLLACAGLDSTSLELAQGNKTQQIRVGAQSHWKQEWVLSGGSHVTGYWDFTLGYWNNYRYLNILDNTQHLVDVGVAPIFRLQGGSTQGLYGEMGVGPYLLSAQYDNNGRRLSTHFQFRTRLGVGYVLRNGMDIGLKIEHVSNGGIKEPNSGVNLAGLRVAYLF